MSREHRCLIVGLQLCLLVVPSFAAEPVQPLPLAHAHNDYLHDRPLTDALDNGFCSVEADIFLVGKQLLVAHSRLELKPERTLKRLYLEPLRERIKANGGDVYPAGPGFTLLIDIKSDGPETYAALDALLAEYADVFSSVDNGTPTKRAVTAVISGNRPTEVVAADSLRFVGVDGRLTDLESDLPAHLLPLISDNWRLHFKWRGDGDIPLADRKKLEQIVRSVHASGRRIRFWATPDTQPVWRVLRDAKVDLINTDDLVGLSKFLRQ